MSLLPRPVARLSRGDPWLCVIAVARVVPWANEVPGNPFIYVLSTG
jgi:hypothetical protein